MADYSVLTIGQIRQLVSGYDLGSVIQAEAMKGGQANSSYKLTTEKGIFILSVCDEKQKEDVDSLTAILRWLQRYDFPTSRPVATRAQQLVVEYGNKPVYLKEFIAGNVVRHLSKSMLFQVGRTVSELHAIEAPDNITNQFPYGLETFAELSGYNHPYSSWLAERAVFLGQAIDPAMERGFIHGDIYWDNLLFSGESLVAVLDFEEACHYYTLYDLGVCAVGCCSGADGLDMRKVRALLRGYQQGGPLTEPQKQQLKVFIEYAGVAGSFWRFRQYNIRRPTPQLQDSYKELSLLAEQAHAMPLDEFLEYCRI